MLNYDDSVVIKNTHDDPYSSSPRNVQDIYVVFDSLDYGVVFSLVPLATNETLIIGTI